MLILVTLFFSCHEAEEFKENEKTIYFQFEYINHAWGYVHQGFVIDQNGNIYDYDQPEGWNFADDNTISLQEFQQNLNKSEVRLSIVDGEELQRMLALAPQVTENRLTDIKGVMADAGAEFYNVYISGEGETNLTRYLLQMRGDNYHKNTSSAADEITAFLIGIRGEEPFSDEHF